MPIQGIAGMRSRLREFLSAPAGASRSLLARQGRLVKRNLFPWAAAALIFALIAGGGPVSAAGGEVGGVAANWIVAQDGTGDSKTVQAALDAAPRNSASPYVIFIKPGTYREKLTIGEDRPFIHFVGPPADQPVLAYGDYAQEPGPDGKPMGTFSTQSVFIKGHDFEAENITFSNTAFPRWIVGQAVAVRDEADRSEFINCRFLGNQDTLFANAGRQYYDRCFIEGDVDYIFGNASAVFDHCTIESVGKGYVSAQSRTDPSQQTGFVFVNCKLEGSAPAGSVDLGRPWRPYARVVYIDCDLGGNISAAGWNNWRDPKREKTAYFAECGSHGPGADAGRRAAWSHQLTADQAAQFLPGKFLAGSDGWNPANTTEGQSNGQIDPR